jgi:hypothetical protein
LAKSEFKSKAIWGFRVTTLLCSDG